MSIDACSVVSVQQRTLWDQEVYKLHSYRIRSNSKGQIKTAWISELSFINLPSMSLAKGSGQVEGIGNVNLLTATP